MVTRVVVRLDAPETQHTTIQIITMGRAITKMAPTTTPMMAPNDHMVFPLQSTHEKEQVITKHPLECKTIYYTILYK